MEEKTVISKTMLVDAIAEKTQVGKKDVKAVIDAFMELIPAEVKADKEIRLIGFGTFKKSHRSARKGRNPSTGAEIDIPASDSLGFKTSIKF